MKVSIKLYDQLYQATLCVPASRRAEVDVVMDDVDADMIALESEVTAADAAGHVYSVEEERAVLQRCEAITKLAIQRVEALALIAA